MKAQEDPFTTERWLERMTRRLCYCTVHQLDKTFAVQIVYVTDVKVDFLSLFQSSLQVEAVLLCFHPSFGPIHFMCPSINVVNIYQKNQSHLVSVLLGGALLIRYMQGIILNLTIPTKKVHHHPF